MSAKPKPYHVGQEVLITDSYSRNREPRKAYVSRVGRLNVYVNFPPYRAEQGFTMATGWELGDRGSKARIWTPEAYADHKAAQVVREALRDAGVGGRYGGNLPERLTLDQLRRILAIVEENVGGTP